MSKPIEPCYGALGLRVRMIRETLGLTQDELAKRVGLDRTSVVNFESGKQRILMHNIPEYATALGITPKHLLRGIWT